MWKIVSKFGLVKQPEPKAEPLGLLHASAEPGSAREHWITLSSTLKTLLGIAALAGAFITQHTLTASRIAVLEADRDNDRKVFSTRLDKQAEALTLLRESVIPRQQYYTDKAEQNATNMRLAEDEHQILLLMARGKEGN